MRNEEDEQVEVKVGGTIDPELRRGIYANELVVTQMREEAVLDFVQTSLGPPAERGDSESAAVARIIITVGLANRIKDLFERLEFKSEEEPVDDHEMPQEGVK